MSETKQEIGITKVVNGDFNEVIEKVTAALAEQGFGILTTIDVKATLKKKLDEDFINYTILGACNPPLAFKALSTTLDVGLLMPCNVTVSEREPGVITVAAMNPGLMNDVLPEADLSELATTGKAKLEAALASL